jgi:hypothetical protein
LQKPTMHPYMTMAMYFYRTILVSVWDLKIEKKNEPSICLYNQTNGEYG